MQEPELAVVELQVVLSERDDIDELVVVYLLASILKRASIGETTLPGEVSLFRGMFHRMHMQQKCPQNAGRIFVWAGRQMVMPCHYYLFQACVYIVQVFNEIHSP